MQTSVVIRCIGPNDNVTEYRNDIPISNIVRRAHH